MSTHLLNQAERICDEAGRGRFSVIVQTRVDDPGIGEILGAAREAIERRSRTVSARDLMPPLASDLKRKRMTAAAKKKLRDSGQSVASAMVMNSVDAPSLAAMKSHGKKSVSKVLKTDAVQRLVEKSSKRGDVVSFWASGSLVLEVSKKDDLIELAKDESMDSQLSAIYPNRVMRAPSPPSVKNLPEAVSAAENEISTWGLQKTGAMACWGAFDAKGKGVKVAVLDTGVDAKHDALTGRVTKFAEFDSRGNTVKDGDGSIAQDSGMHGTHCCGTVAGGNGGKNGQLKIGMAPEAELHCGLVLKGGSGTDAQILAGMQWAIDSGADVISMSLGGLRMTPDVFDTYTRTIITANRRGIPVVIAMGNDGHQTSGAPGNDFFAFSVGATDVIDRAAGFSGGRTQIIDRSRYINPQYLPLVYSKPDVSAPGVAVYSCIPGNKYDSWNGTSMATPHVAGAIALLLSGTKIGAVDRGRRAYLIQDILTATVDELGESGQDQRYGYGRIDVLRAIGYARHLGYGKET